MYVCLCNAITDRQVRSALDQAGARTPAQVFRQLGCTPRCGKCLPFVADMTRGARDEGDVAEPVLACAR